MSESPKDGTSQSHSLVNAIVTTGASNVTQKLSPHAKTTTSRPQSASLLLKIATTTASRPTSAVHKAGVHGSRPNSASSQRLKAANSTRSEDLESRLLDIRIGTEVEVDFGGLGDWYVGIVRKDREDGTFDVEYDYGDIETHVAIDRMRVPKSPRITTDMLLGSMSHSPKSSVSNMSTQNKVVMDHDHDAFVLGDNDSVIIDMDQDLNSVTSFEVFNLSPTVNNSQRAQSLALEKTEISPHFPVNTTVEANYHAEGIYHVGKVVNIRELGAIVLYDVDYENGDMETHIEADRLRLPASSAQHVGDMSPLAMISPSSARAATVNMFKEQDSEPVPVFSLNSRVLGNYLSRGVYYPGTIIKVRSSQRQDGTYDIAYDDGEMEVHVEASHIKPHIATSNISYESLHSHNEEVVEEGGGEAEKFVKDVIDTAVKQQSRPSSASAVQQASGAAEIEIQPAAVQEAQEVIASTAVSVKVEPAAAEVAGSDGTEVTNAPAAKIEAKSGETELVQTVEAPVNAEETPGGEVESFVKDVIDTAVKQQSRPSSASVQQVTVAAAVEAEASQPQDVEQVSSVGIVQEEEPQAVEEVPVSTASVIEAEPAAETRQIENFVKDVVDTAVKQQSRPTSATSATAPVATEPVKESVLEVQHEETEQPVAVMAQPELKQMREPAPLLHGISSVQHVDDNLDDIDDPPVFPLHTRIKANYLGRGVYYPGSIIKIRRDRGDGSYDIAYDDGEMEVRVEGENIRLESDISVGIVRAVLPKRNDDDTAVSVKAAAVPIAASTAELLEEPKVVIETPVLAVNEETASLAQEAVDSTENKLVVNQELPPEAVNSEEAIIATEAIQSVSAKANENDELTNPAVVVEDTSNQHIPPAQAVATVVAAFNEGDKVEVNYRNTGKFFPGRIRRVHANGTYDIDFDDGERETDVLASDIKSLEASSAPSAAPGTPLKEGDKVEANYRSRGKYYPGKVKLDRGDASYDIDYDDGEMEERVEATNIRLVEAAFANSQFKAGDRIQVTFDHGFTKLGVIHHENDDGTYGISYDEGDGARRVIEANIQPSTADRIQRTATIKESDTVEANYRGKGKYYRGRVSQVHDTDGSCDIDYDDGEKEVHVRACYVNVLIPSKPLACNSFDAAGEEANDTSDEGAVKAFVEGDKVEANYRGKGKYYPGSIIKIRRDRGDGSYDIAYDDGEMEVRVEATNIRLLPLSVEPPLATITADSNASTIRFDTSSHRKFAVGECVEASFGHDDKFYPGHVSQEHADGTYDIDYDDGDKRLHVKESDIKAILIQQPEPVSGEASSAEATDKLIVGDRVEVNYRSRGKYYPGKVKLVRYNDTYDIDYDDGEVEVRVEASNIRKLSVVSEAIVTMSLGDTNTSNTSNASTFSPLFEASGGKQAAEVISSEPTFVPEAVVVDEPKAATQEEVVVVQQAVEDGMAVASPVVAVEPAVEDTSAKVEIEPVDIIEPFVADESAIVTPAVEPAAVEVPSKPIIPSTAVVVTQEHVAIVDEAVEMPSASEPAAAVEDAVTEGKAEPIITIEPLVADEAVPVNLITPNAAETPSELMAPGPVIQEALGKQAEHHAAQEVDTIAADASPKSEAEVEPVVIIEPIIPDESVHVALITPVAASTSAVEAHCDEDGVCTLIPPTHPAGTAAGSAIKEGDQVLVTSKTYGDQVAAKVQRVRQDGTYDVEYENEEIEIRLLPEQVAKATPSSSANTTAATVVVAGIAVAAIGGAAAVTVGALAANSVKQEPAAKLSSEPPAVIVATTQEEAVVTAPEGKPDTPLAAATAAAVSFPQADHKKPLTLLVDVQVGDRVMADYKHKGRYYPGIISHIHSDQDSTQAFDVEYDDGDYELQIPPHLLFKLEPDPKDQDKKIHRRVAMSPMERGMLSVGDTVWVQTHVKDAFREVTIAKVCCTDTGEMKYDLTLAHYSHNVDEDERQVPLSRLFIMVPATDDLNDEQTAEPVKIGSFVMCQYPGQNKLYPGHITKIYGEEDDKEKQDCYDILFEDDEVAEAVHINDIHRSKVLSTAKSLASSSVNSHASSSHSSLVKTEKVLRWAVGDRVEVRFFNDEKYYAGDVTAVHEEDGTIDVRYDHNDQEEKHVLLGYVRPTLAVKPVAASPTSPVTPAVEEPVATEEKIIAAAILPKQIVQAEASKQDIKQELPPLQPTLQAKEQQNKALKDHIEFASKAQASLQRRQEMMQHFQSSQSQQRSNVQSVLNKVAGWKNTMSQCAHSSQQAVDRAKNLLEVMKKAREEVGTQ